MTIAMIPAVLEERAVAAAATLAGTCAHATSAKVAFGDHATACVRWGRMQACGLLPLPPPLPPQVRAASPHSLIMENISSGHHAYSWYLSARCLRSRLHTSQQL